MKYCLLLLGILAGYTGSAQQNITLFDMQSGPAHGDPVGFTHFKDKLFFYANLDTNGIELCYTDGRSAPQVVADMHYRGDGAPGPIHIRGKMAELGGELYFMATNGHTGYELYKYNGIGSPKLTKNMEPGMNGLLIDYIVPLKGKLYFRAGANTTGAELWSHDPANNSFKVVRDLTPGEAGSDVKDLVVYKDKLYFTAETAASGNELYVYDPATGNVDMVADIAAGSRSSSPKGMVVAGGKLYFSAITASQGRELYVYDGTANPVRLTDLYPGTKDGVLAASPNSIGFLNTGVYFAGTNGINNYQLYKYDYVTGNTTLVHTINPNGSSAAAHFCIYTHKMFFSANDGVNGTELWTYDGERAPRMIADIRPGFGGSHPAELTVINGSLCFNAQNGYNGKELYRYTDPKAGMNGVVFDGEIKVYPNPVTTFLNVDISLKQAEKLQVRLTDNKGYELYNSGLTSFGATAGHISIPVEHLVPGSYFYYVCNEAGLIYSKGSIIKP